MSTYTTEVRWLCEHYAGSEGSIDKIIHDAIPRIFDFSFPIFQGQYREVLCHKILKHYYTREIGEETVGLWKLRMNAKLNEIMPYYNQLYESALLDIHPMTNEKWEENYTGNINGNEDTNFTGTVTDKQDSTTTGNASTNEDTTNTTTRNDNTTTSSNTTASSNSNTVFSDTPQGYLANGTVGDPEYASNVTAVLSESTDDTSGHTNVTGTDKLVIDGSVTQNTTTSTDATATSNTQNDESRTKTESNIYKRLFEGYRGVSAADLLLKFRETFMNIDMMVINELEPLFMSIW